LIQRINNRWNIAFRPAFDSRDFGVQNFNTTFTFDTASEKVTTSWNQLQVQYQGNKHIVDYKGELVYFCCNDCKIKFDQDPEKYMKKDRPIVSTGI
jgi:YHS domain-containing protein